MKPLKMLSLFSGIGGIDLAAQWAGIETVAFCEIDPFCQKVLKKHWPEVHIFDDIKNLSADSIRGRGINTDIDIIAGGFPCQPFSTAGKQRGKEDDRYLWPEMLRVISELKPTWVVGENVSGFAGLVQFKESPKVDDEGNAIGEVGELFNRTGRFIAPEVLESLEEIGYEVQIFNIPACGINAQHKRERIFIVGYSEHNGLLAEQELRGNEATSNQRREKEQAQTWELARTSRPFNVSGLRGSKDGGKWNKRYYYNRVSPKRCDWWEAEPDVDRVAYGVPDIMDRIKSLGNAVVPQQIYPIFQAIQAISAG